MNGLWARSAATSMVKLFGFSFEGSTFEVLGATFTGQERLIVDGQQVASRYNWRMRSRYVFMHERLGELELQFKVDPFAQRVHYQLHRGGAVVFEAESDLTLPAWLSPQSEPAPAVPGAPADHTAAQKTPKLARLITVFGVLTKLAQTGKVIKVALAGMAVSGWTILYSLPFALALVATLVFHEWGHLRAMRHFGMKTKGMYLIPFVGGLAIGERPRSQWQEVHISMMGPFYGLGMTVACYLAFLATGNSFVGLLASLSGLINVVNLLPLHPLDGGRVVKALVVSGGSRLAFLVFVAFSAVAFAASAYLGLALLCFFIVLGALDLLATWKQWGRDERPRLNRYGLVFCSLWYLGTLAAFVGIILLIARTGLPGSELAVRVLGS